MAVDLLSIGLLGPGLPGWAASRAILAGEAPWVPAPFAPPPPALLAPTERRRTSAAVRLALAVAAEAVAASGLEAASLDTLFASSSGDGALNGAILTALFEPEGAISPTQFHNSVHNAAAGYWGIGAGSMRASASLGGHDGVFAAGLLQAAIQVASEDRPLLYVASDTPLVPPLAATRPMDDAFGVAFVLAPAGLAAPLARLRVAYGAESCDEPPPWLQNPCARSVPLLAAVAARRAAVLHFATEDATQVVVEVCP